MPYKIEYKNLSKVEQHLFNFIEEQLFKSDLGLFSLKRVLFALQNKYSSLKKITI